MNKLWGGRFEGGLDPLFERFNRSLGVDHVLWQEDIRGSIAWARALLQARVLTDAEHSQIVAHLKSIESELHRSDADLRASQAEDVHTFIETRLTELCGDLARKLHTGRSRNDQVATDLKLYIKECTKSLRRDLADLMSALLDLSEPNAALPIPGYTHLQRAQPITVGHHLLAYVEMFSRDRSRFDDLAARMDTCPLGSGALAGTAFPIDRAALATELGFQGPTRNSLDAVSDRDYLCELAFTCSLIFVHLSRLAEDWIFFASQEASFLELSDAVATGSSLMPQKKNPDGLELLRGKTGRVFGHLHALLVMLKGLPLAYDKDLQEDKEAVFDCIQTTHDSLRVAAVIVKSARFRAEHCASEAARGYLNATDLADLLVRSGVPFRTAHERAGATVRAALERGVELDKLPDDVRKKLLPEIAHLSNAELTRELSVESVLARRNVIGGTAPARVQLEVQAWKKKIETWNNRP